MLADLRLELDRIERSILILQTLACPNPTKWTVPLKRERGSPARFAGSSALSVSSRTNKVISIARGDSRPPSGANSLEESPEEDLSRSLRELRAQTAKFQKAVSALVRKPGDSA